jgi:predicted membrane protein
MFLENDTIGRHCFFSDSYVFLAICRARFFIFVLIFLALPFFFAPFIRFPVEIPRKKKKKKNCLNTERFSTDDELALNSLNNRYIGTKMTAGKFCI